MQTGADTQVIRHVSVSQTQTQMQTQILQDLENCSTTNVIMYFNPCEKLILLKMILVRGFLCLSCKSPIIDPEDSSSLIPSLDEGSS